MCCLACIEYEAGKLSNIDAKRNLTEYISLKPGSLQDEVHNNDLLTELILDGLERNSGEPIT